MDVSGHDRERSVEEGAHGIHVAQIALEDDDAAPDGTDGVDGGGVWGMRAGTSDETEGSACLGEGEGTRGADAWQDHDEKRRRPGRDEDMPLVAPVTSTFLPAREKS